MKKIALISLFSMVFGTLLFAQDTDSVEPVQIVGGSFRRPIPPQTQVDLIPKFRGTLRTRYEYDINENLNRFAIRNARASVRGNANQWITYLMQVDLSDNGVFRVLDAEINFKIIENLKLTIGQTFVPFTQKHLLTPGAVLFTNMAFVNQYMSGAPRDIGMFVDYHFLVRNTPITLSGGLFNGKSINNSEWVHLRDLAYALRAMFGSMDNFQFALKTYQIGSLAEDLSWNTDTNRVRRVGIIGADMRYFNNTWSDGFTFEAEVVNGFGYADLASRYGGYLQAGNRFNTGNYKVKYIEPVARWDMMKITTKGMIMDEHGNWTTYKPEPANRLTFGVNFGFNRQYRKTELRLNYEKYFMPKDKYFADWISYSDIYFGVGNTSWHDRIVLELIINF
jgi:hypothetical protein